MEAVHRNPGKKCDIERGVSEQCRRVYCTIEREYNVITFRVSRVGSARSSSTSVGRKLYFGLGFRLSGDKYFALTKEV